MPDAAALPDPVRALEALAAAAPDGRVGRRSHGPARRRRRRTSLGAVLRTNMTPMIDVVFQLLVFFIATTRYAGDERVLAMEVRPRAEARAPDAAARPAAAGAFVLADESLRLEVLADGSVVAGPPLRRRFTPHELAPALAAELRGTAHPKGMFEQTFPIVIAPGTGASWEAAVGALDACVAAGYRNVGFDGAPAGAGGAP